MVAKPRDDDPYLIAGLKDGLIWGYLIGLIIDEYLNATGRSSAVSSLYNLKENSLLNFRGYFYHYKLDYNNEPEY